MATPHGAASAGASQTTTAATGATSQAAQTGAVAQHAQTSLLHSVQALQALQAAQAAARSAAANANNLGLNPNSPGQTLPNVPDGLAAGGLVPGVSGVDAADPKTVATTVPVVANANGSSSVSLAASSAITIPTTISGPETITALGSGVIGTVTTGSVITPLKGGVATTIAPGSTISITQTGGSTVTFASGSAGIPASFSTYNYGAASVPSSWSGIGGLTQSTYAPTAGQTTGQTTVTITQTQQQALLTWQSFNIGKNTLLDFDQSAGGANVSQWVAINQIKDPTIAPSQILGAIQAPGQVYVINQNGIIFGGQSQVNVGALTASSLALNPAYIANGLLNDAGNDFQFQFSSLFTTTTASTGAKGHKVTTTTVAPLWTAPPVVPAGGVQTVSSVATGDVTVQSGAQINALTNAENQGGRVALIAPNVVNNGTISTPDGQTILAAGLQVGFASHNATDASLRGLDVYIGQVSGVSSTLPTTGTFIFNGLPNDDVANGTGTPTSYDLTFTGTGQVGTYTPPGSTTPVTLNGGTTVAIPVGSTVSLTSGGSSFTATGQEGIVTNASGGDIEAPRADVTLTGATVNQLGIINGSTSVTLNGRIDLLADYNSAAGLAGGVTAFYPFMTGTVTLGGDSVTQILPELSDTATTIGTSLPVSSLINIEALSINMLPGSLILAPSANKPSAASNAALDFVGASLTSGVTLDAGSWFVIGSTPGDQTTTFSNTTGDINLGTGSVIDVSGSENVSASVAEDIIAVDLRGPQLANSPLQQNGALRGDTVYVDIRDSGIYNGTAWIGTPIGDVSGFVNNIERTVGELTTDGGSVALNAGHSVNIGTGASVNVSGGWINYAGANVQTTKVITNGQILDISQATPNLVYSGIYTGFSTTSTKWGVQQGFNNSLLSGTQYDAGYVQGGNGGTVSIAAPAVSLAGNLYGNTVSGSLQRTPDSTLSSTYSGATFLPSLMKIDGTPDASTFDLSFLDPKVGNSTNVYQSTSPDVVFQTDSFIAAQTTPVANQVLLSQDIVNLDGFGNVTIDTRASGTITVPEGVSLTTTPGGLISFTAANIDIEGSMAAPGGGTTGGLSFTVEDTSPTAQILSTPAADPTRGHFTLGADASLSSSGVIVDDLPTAAAADTSPFATGGGTISISGLYVDLKTGSKIDVSGGVALSSTGTETYGNAGSISILGGQDPGLQSLVLGGQLFLGSTLTGYSGKAGGGGSLTIQAPLVQIGGQDLLNKDSSGGSFVSGEASVSGNGNTLWLNKTDAQGNSTDFFSQGGFGNFTIEGLGQIEMDSSGAYVFNSVGDPVISPAMLIAANTHISPVVQSYVTTFDGNTISLNPMGLAQAAALLPSQRTAVNLNFNAEGVSSSLTQGGDGPPEQGGGTFQSSGGSGGILVRGDLVMQAGASIQTDPQTNSSHGVSLSATHGTVAILGTVNAPGGTISVKGGDTTSFKNNDLLFYESSPTQPFATVDLGPDSMLSTAGVTEQTVNSLGFVTGSVLGGGNIVISGNIVAEAGSTLDVSGSSAVLDETAASLGSTAGSLSAQSYIPTQVASNAGSITFNATQLLYSDATLLGAAGSSTAQGGSLSVSSKFSATLDPTVLPPSAQDITLIVTQAGLNGGFSLPSNSATGLAVVDGQVIPGSNTAVGATANSAVGGEGVYSYFAANPNLFVSKATDNAASDNGGRGGGFTSLSLGGTVDFIGPVTITTKSSLNIAKTAGDSGSGFTGGVIYADSAVVLTAPYISLNGYETSLLPDVAASAANPAATGGMGSLTVNASVLTDVGNLSLQDISTLNFNATSGTAGDIRGQGTLQVADQINMNAAQIYPPTESTFTVEANDISITAPANQALPALPLSGGGTLNLFANTIEQGGVLRAPFGIINLGNSSTQSITLKPGSITSVSGVDPTTGLGITVPYGIVNDNGTWFDPNGNDISLNGPPAKAVNITSQNVDIKTGSTIDLTGGGNLSAYSFTPGTGGTQDILASLTGNFTSTSFAILPGYSSNYAPDGTYALNNNLQTNNVQDIGYYNSALTVGEQITLNGSNGLPAGTYTLLPARYALLPGAFLVTASGSGAPGASIAQSDGSSLVSGYLTSGLNSTSSPVFGAFQIYSQSTVLARAPYTINLANTYFPSTAASHNLSSPRLPVDSGQLLLDATQTMTIEGTLLSQAGVGGLGGEVDIASPEDIYIVGPTTAGDAPAGALVLDSSQLTDFGAASLLIGGFRTTTEAGTTVTVTTDKLVVDNSGATTTIDGTTVDGLAGPDIILASNGTLDVDAGSTIEQMGQLSGKAQTLTLQGNGVLLRVSSDSSAQISRQNVVAGDTTSVLSIAQGATIRNANGGAAGSLILDSSALVSVDPIAVNAPILDATALTFDSSLINLEAGTPVTAPTAGLVITKPQLDALLASTQSLSFLSYSSIALYGSGEIGVVSVDASGAKTYQEANLSLHADDIYYADTQNSSGIVINAQTVSLDNLSGNTILPTVTGLGMSKLTINAQTITLGSNATRMDQFTNVALNADSAILIKGLGSKAANSDATPTPASFSTSGNLVLTTPLITSAATADQSVSPTTTVGIDETINAAGTLVIQAPASTVATVPSPGALAANLQLTGSSVTQNSGSIVLHSGTVGLQATSGDVAVDGTIDVTGVSPAFFNLNKFTNGGQVSLASLHGNVSMGSSGLIDVSAASGTGTVDSGAGSAGSVSISAAGTFTAGQIKGQAGTVTSSTSGPVIAQGAGGVFSLDVGSLDPAGNGLLSSFENELTGFDQQTIRDRTDATVTVDDTIKASSFALSADQGSVVVSGTIDASNVAAVDSLGNAILVGGTISLEAGGSVTLQSGSVLNASGANLNNAGQGGTVTLQAGAYEGTSVATTSASINLGGTINLGINGGAGGTLYLRAPQVSGGAYVSGSTYTPVAVNASGGGTPTDVAIIGPIANGAVQNASNIVVEGFYVQDADQATALIDNYKTTAESNAGTFMGQSTTIETRIFGSTLANVNVRPGEEIDNSGGNLELQGNWDLSLSSLRYGASAEPGMLTIRAAGNISIDFGASLSDGFNGVTYTSVLLPPNNQSWSYNITSGADFSAASSSAVQSAAQLGSGGNFLLGVQNSPAPIFLSNSNTDDPSVFFQTIRTGTGNITIQSGGDVLLLNELATIYTAGSQVDPTLGGTFVAPSGTGLSKQTLPSSYSTGGGNVSISAQGNIERETYNGVGNTLVADSSPELPTSWLDREGSVSNGQVVTPTTWWIDFTNFFEGVGALGGGNVTLSAGGSVVNVDAAVPTNGRVVNGQLTELGGGNLLVSAGNNIDGGVYYVESGQGTLAAGNDIQTNATRAAVPLGGATTSIDDLPTTLFLGKGDFSVSAGGDLLLGPVANPFLLPQSINNTASSLDLTSELSYFSTYAATDSVNASSLAGKLTIQDFADGAAQGSLYAWYINVLNASVVNPSPGSELSDAEPWLQLAEATNPNHVVADFAGAGTLPLGSPDNVFGGVTALLPPTLRATAFSGDLNLIGSLTLSPSANGTINLVAAGSINAFEVNDTSTLGVVSFFSGSALVNLSDADPSALPGINTPLSSGSQLVTLDPLFTTTGVTEGLTLQTRQELHADINGASLHANDPNPVYIYANTGDISGLTLYSAKQAQVVAGQDITDIGLYIQNNQSSDISLVSAGRDIIAYDASSPLRLQAGINLLGYDPDDGPIGHGSGAPNSGDIQISGPGTLEVLAGRNLTLGNDAGQNPNATVAGDGLNTGLTSVGGQLNPILPFAGADLIATAGVGGHIGSENSALNFTNAAGTGFTDLFLNPASAQSARYLPDLGTLMGLDGETDAQVWAAFNQLTPAAQDALATKVFYLVLRDAGRDHNDSSSSGFGTYTEGYVAVSALLGETNLENISPNFVNDQSVTMGGQTYVFKSVLTGAPNEVLIGSSKQASIANLDQAMVINGPSISVTSREIKTSNGGDISLLVAGGKLTVGVNQPTGQAVDQGILTVDGGNINIATDSDVVVGTSRIFTLHGGNEVIWSSAGGIAAGAASVTVVSAPPTRVLVDPTSGDVQTDLAGLSTGGGIGVLASVIGAPPGDVDLIAPFGTVDAGDAGIRASGKVNIAAAAVANSSHISSGAGTTGVATTSSVNLGALSAASSAAGSSTAAAGNTSPAHQNMASSQQDVPSIITVEVLGYGGGDQD